ncbi:MAG: ATP-binding protein [Candidatus Obscuribacterales bacterium]|nr:ATP-binding protein [Candidatus Obscuribacterales bacterium]
MYDPFAYFSMFNLGLPEYLEVLPSKLYNLVFIFDRLPWVNDGIRHEGDKFAKAIEPFFKSNYTHRGVDLIHVPVFTFTEDDLTDDELQKLSKETDYETRQANLKQVLIDKSIAKRGQYIIGKIKANFPEVELPAGV